MLDIKQVFPYYNDTPILDGDYLRGKTIEEVVQSQLANASLCTGFPILAHSDPTYTEQYTKIFNNVSKKVSEYAAHAGERMFYVMIQEDLGVVDGSRRVSMSMISLWEGQWDEFISKHDIIRHVSENYKTPLFTLKPTSTI